MKNVSEYRLGHWQSELGYCTLELPKGTEVVSVGTRDDNICVWAIVDSNEEEVEKKTLLVLRENEGFRDDGPVKFIGTAHLTLWGDFTAFHIFEVKNDI